MPPFDIINKYDAEKTPSVESCMQRRSMNERVRQSLHPPRIYRYPYPLPIKIKKG
jgi:hypothetical protein